MCTMFKSLWFRLSVYFTVLILAALCMLGALPDLLLNTKDAQRLLIPKVIHDTLKTEQLILTQIIKEPDSKEWQALAKQNLSDRLVNVQIKNELVNLKGSFDSNLYYRVFNNENESVYSEPAIFPDSVETVFISPKEMSDGSNFLEWQQDDDSYFFWTTMPLIDSSGQV